MLGMLIEKIISIRLQVYFINLNFIYPNQMEGIKQWSIIDASIYLTHIIYMGQIKDLYTSTFIFNIAQFFSSLNYQLLLKIFGKAGFDSHISHLFHLLIIVFLFLKKKGMKNPIQIFFVVITSFLLYLTSLVQLSNTKNQRSFISQGPQTIIISLSQIFDLQEALFSILKIFGNIQVSSLTRNLSFINKALSTIKSMKMLENSSRSLLPIHKQLLYRICVCYDCCLLDMAWTRVKGNDDMIGYAIIVSVSISCSRCNNLARSSCFITHSPHVQQAYSSWTTSIYSINTLLYSYTLPIDSSPTSSLNLCLSCNLSQV